LSFSSFLQEWEADRIRVDPEFEAVHMAVVVVHMAVVVVHMTVVVAVSRIVAASSRIAAAQVAPSLAAA